MAYPNSRSSWHPTNWNAVTWIVFVVWLAFGVLHNLPLEPKDETFAGEADSSPTSYSVFIGWPLSHTEFSHQFGASPPVRRTDPASAAIDVVLVALVQIAIVATCQRWFRRFSLRQLFSLIAVIAVIIVAGQFALAAPYYAALPLFMYSVYFLPVASWFLTALFRGGQVKGGNET